MCMICVCVCVFVYMYVCSLEYLSTHVCVLLFAPFSRQIREHEERLQRLQSSAATGEEAQRSYNLRQRRPTLYVCSSLCCHPPFSASRSTLDCPCKNSYDSLLCALVRSFWGCTSCSSLWTWTPSLRTQPRTHLLLPPRVVVTFPKL